VQVNVVQVFLVFALGSNQQRSPPFRRLTPARIQRCAAPISLQAVIERGGPTGRATERGMPFGSSTMTFGAVPMHRRAAAWHGWSSTEWPGYLRN